MSSAEITLGSHLFVKGIEEEIDQLINQNPDYVSLQLAYRDMGKWLARNKCVTRAKDGSWAINNDGIAKLGDEKAASFLGYYQTAVLAHEQAAGNLVRDGKIAYMDEFRELHSETIFDVTPETITRVRGEDMRAITGASLNLLQAVHDDPANAAFVTGLDKASLDTLWKIMEDSGYLMPGENPDREAPLGDQHLRGTPEEQESLYSLALTMSANLDLPEVANHGDRPMTAALMFDRAVKAAQSEEVEVGTVLEDGWDSDLTATDCNALYNVLLTGTRVVHSANWDTQSLDTVLVDPHLLDDLKIALADYDDKLIANCLSSGSFGDPKIDISNAERLAKGINWLKQAVSSDVNAERFSGDDGGMLTQEGQTMAEDGEYGDKEISSDKENSEGDEERDSEAQVQVENAEGDMAAHLYGASERKARLPEPMLYEADLVLLEMLDNGTAEYLRQRAGRADVSMGEIASSGAAFGSIEEAMGQFRESYEGHQSGGHNPKVITVAQKASMHPQKRAKIHATSITAGRGLFEDYRHGAPSASKKRVTRYIDKKMLLPDGSPNLKMRQWLRDAAADGVFCQNRQEGEAAVRYAERFVERDRHEVDNSRDEARRKDQGISEITFSSAEISRMIQVKESSETDQLVRLTMEADGTAYLSDENAPQVGGRMDKMPKDFEKASKSPRKFGGMVDLEWLKAAQQTGTEQITILVAGETPYAAIGKREQVAERKKTRPKQVVLG